jgi:hypothetical protein
MFTNDKLAPTTPRPLTGFYPTFRDFRAGAQPASRVAEGGPATSKNRKPCPTLLASIDTFKLNAQLAPNNSILTGCT